MGVVPGGLAIQALLVAGVSDGIFFTSAITVLISVMDYNRLGGIIYWLLGNLAPIPAGSLALFAVLALGGCWLIVRHARELNLLALGEEAAVRLGVGAVRLKRRRFGARARLTGTGVA